jgi:hypothetical protein
MGLAGEEAAFCGFGLSCLTADWTPCSFCDKGPRRRRMTTIISSSVRLFFSSISLTTAKHCGQDVLYCMNFLMQTEQTKKLEMKINYFKEYDNLMRLTVMRAWSNEDCVHEFIADSALQEVLQNPKVGHGI